MLGVVQLESGPGQARSLPERRRGPGQARSLPERNGSREIQCSATALCLTLEAGEEKKRKKEKDI